jgi:hypothetical protein
MVEIETYKADAGQVRACLCFASAFVPLCVTVYRSSQLSQSLSSTTLNTEPSRTEFEEHCRSRFSIYLSIRC